MSQSRHSRRIVPITLSHIEFALGLATGDRTTSTPNALIEFRPVLLAGLAVIGLVVMTGQRSARGEHEV